jgi:MFS transporter, DHA1 family, multidrug resistance protein
LKYLDKSIGCLYLCGMKRIQDKHRGKATILSFALIPLSGFATDIYLPSLPAMAASLHVTSVEIQASLLIFLVSSGVSQMFVGSLLDSYGRYRLSNAALVAFAAASFIIAAFPNIYVLYAMRVVHGITVAIIVVSKRAYFMDTYSGDRLKHYVSLFSIVWATAPIIAPFLGGYLQEAFGWESNFYFLGIFTLAILALTLVYGGESIRHFQPFEARSIIRVYSSMLKTVDFGLGLIIIALSYSMLMVYGMTSPFIIERVFHFSPVVTGYSSLLSGVALMAGGIISKSMIGKPLDAKIPVAIGVQLVLAILMITVSRWVTVSRPVSGIRVSGIYVMLFFVILLHMVAGFIFNNLFAYSLGRFSSNAGVVSGLTGGGLYVITSIFSYGMVSVLAIRNLTVMGVGYLTLVLLIGLAYGLFRKARAAAGIGARQHKKRPSEETAFLKST